MSKAFFDELHIIDLMAALSQGRQSEYHTPLDIDKIRAAALISQNRRQATVLCQGAWMTSRRNNGFFIIPCFAAYRFIARSYDYILAFLMHSRL